MPAPDPALSAARPDGAERIRIAPRRHWPWLVAAAMILAGGAAWFLIRPKAPPLPAPVPDMEDHQVKALLEKAHQAIVDNPRSGQAWGRLGMIYFANDYRGPALDLFIQAEKLDPTDYRWPYLQGIFLYDHGKQQALVCFERAHRLATTTDFPAYRLGLVYLMQGRSAEAARLFRELLARSPGNGLASLGLGKVALENNDLAEAEAHFRKAAELTLPRREAFSGLVGVYSKKNEPLKAAHYQKLFDLLPSDGADYDAVVQEVVKNHVTGLKLYLTKGRQHIFDQDFRQAKEVMENALREYPEDARALGLMAYVLVEMARKTPPPERDNLLDRAEAHLNKAVKINPKQAHTWQRLGMIYHERGQGNDSALRQALTYYEKSLALNQNQEMVVVSYATCWKDLGELDKAIDLLAEFARSRPDVPQVWAQLGSFLRLAGRDLEAWHFLWLAVQEQQPAALEKVLALTWRLDL